MNMEIRLHRFGNYVGLLFICAVLFYAFVDQISTHDLPCPLCLLQRACFIAVGIGLSLNLKMGVHTRHYGLILFSALIGLFIAVRQIFLHLPSGTTGYGNMVWGLYFYDWAAIAFCTILALTGLALTLENGFHGKEYFSPFTFYGAMVLFVILILANVVSTFLECGWGTCVDNPIHYDWLN